MLLRYFFTNSSYFASQFAPIYVKLTSKHLDVFSPDYYLLLQVFVESVIKTLLG